MDYSKLSDEEIDALVAQRQSELTPVANFADATDDELNQMVKAKKAGIAPKKERVVQEMPEALSWKDRAIVKNFSNNSNDAASFLQEKYPDHDVDIKNNALVMRKKGEKAWKTVDPDTGFFSKDFLHDVADIGFDTLAGFGTSSAMAAGGVAGAAGGGIGALPGAAAAGAAASGGLETLRQSLGKALGIKQDYDKTNIGMATGFGAVSPFMFGTGATSKQLLQRAVADKLDDAGVAALVSSQRGAAGRLYDYGTRKVAPKLGQFVSGIDKGTIKTFANNVDRVKQLEKSGITDLVTDNQEEIVSAVGKAKASIGARVGDAMETAGKKVDITPVKGAFTQLKEKLVSYKDEIDNPLLQEKLKEVLSTYDDLFTKTVQPEAISPLAGLVDEFGAPLIKASGKKAKEEISDSISARAAFKLQQDLAELAELSKMKGGMMSRLSGKTNVAQKELAEVSRSAYNLMNDGLDQATDGLSSELKAEYKKYAQIQKALAPHFTTPEKTYATLKNLGAKNKRILRESLRDVDKELGTKTLENAKFLDAFNTFSDASIDAISGGGVTSTSKTIPMALLGGGVGYYVGDKVSEDMGISGLAGRAIGASLGSFAGAKAGSPAALRMYIEKGLNAEKAGRVLKNTRPVQAAPASAWNYMRDEK